MSYEEKCWSAVVARDIQADGDFVYAVRSTKIYCKPSCPSRKPNRQQVAFFNTAELAEREGYRACLRCRPHSSNTTDTPATIMVEHLCQYIEAHVQETLTLSQLGEEVHMSPYHLQRTFKQTAGITPRQYQEARRLQLFKTQLRAGETITTAIYEVGYGSSSRLYEHAPAHMGMTPSTYRRGGKGLGIAYTIVESPLGRLLVAATQTGVCAVSLGDSDPVLETELHREYPAATIYREDEQLQEWVGELLHFLEGEQPWSHLRLPIDVQATAFQWRVWEMLRTIPAGQTRSYGEVAHMLGDKNKARAVAHACATNPVALLIPCHRVVKGDGHAGGYRWGIERKRRLLAQEKVDS